MTCVCVEHLNIQNANLKYSLSTVYVHKDYMFPSFHNVGDIYNSTLLDNIWQVLRMCAMNIYFTPGSVT